MNQRKNITRYFHTLKRAEQYQNRLYKKYNYVRLIHSPIFDEAGNYTWVVGD